MISLTDDGQLLDDGQPVKIPYARLVSWRFDSIDNRLHLQGTLNGRQPELTRRTAIDGDMPLEDAIKAAAERLFMDLTADTTPRTTEPR